ncbi:MULTISPECIES: cysteine/glutathione ABC transporter ATP-binding protein/permease CydC [Shewanella]|uniref:heme ABC transporter ATP-binding protein/permease CydC n=1 Tax=Shewanella TaxID=22 RepID=UPI000C5F10E5|nr:MULTISPECIES: cysteine/glutathione ABC transporter ATP-binding protein/permease CydC [Shewanella]NCQ44279.1 cysteine/glutathione ABC transporter ATP-binding protein/permease CydC [Shewanella frigidimarina]NCO72662.1 cysteine/glutathione ABC transporter ATP-binding protein/permease CydC [Shewanella vesiculosa]NCP35240.1 cysteine/glutathione ABC transporter ATP-binding protein/permease CydC [Shewanella vesiculosa]NCP69915.1 cysteine/glutathione ABC transporter ATP-binding protein/permease CydC
MQVLRPFVALFRRQWLMMLVGLLLTFITLLTGIGLLSLSGWFLSASAVAGLTVVTAQTFNFFTPAGGVRFFSIARTASRYGERLATHEATFKLLTQLRVWAWNKLLPLSAANLQGLRSGDLLNRLVADIDTLDHLYLRLLTPMAASLMMIGTLLVFLGWFDSHLALSLCALLLAAWLILPLVFYYLGKAPGQVLMQAQRQYRIELLDVIQGQAELSIFGANQRYLAKLEQAQHSLFSQQTTMANITGLSQALLILINGTAVVLMLYFAGQGVGELSPPGPLMALMVFATMASLEMMMPIAGAFQHLSSTVLAARRVTEITEQTPSVVFNLNSDLQAYHGALQITDIHFGYHSHSPVLQGLDLSIHAGEKVAILGPTGCGKSSLLGLITRDWAAQQGAITLDGQPISGYSDINLRAAMTVVSQRIYLFSGTLRDNLALALPYLQGETKKAHDQRFIEVLDKVGLQTLLQGDTPLDCWIGEGGRQLSGGEQRRIGVARALLRDAPLLLLDEPTEGLDKRTEREILKVLLDFAQHKTLLMISHRLTALEQMDAVYLLEQGRLIRQSN